MLDVPSLRVGGTVAGESGNGIGTPLSEIENLLKLEKQSCRSGTSLGTDQLPQAYEEQMQRYEADIRTHISVRYHIVYSFSLDRTAIKNLH